MTRKKLYEKVVLTYMTTFYSGFHVPNKFTVCTKVLVECGTKYLQRIKNATKASTTVMMCGNVTRNFLPHYVIFNVEHVYSTRKEESLLVALH